MTPLLAFTQTAAKTVPAEHASNGGTVIALFVVVAAVALWIALRAFIRGLRAKKTETVTGGDFAGYALAALVNATRLDGRTNEQEKRAIVAAMREIAGEAFEAVKVEEAFAAARLNKDELVDFLSARAGAFSRDQKMALLKALMSVFVADGSFDEAEHGALMDYTAAIGFDRQSAPQMLRGLAGDFRRGNIT